MAREVLTVILLYAAYFFTATNETATDGDGDSIGGSAANSEVICRGVRSLLGQGFHRDLKTHLVITTRNTVEVPTRCETLLIENLSSSFYIDPYQIENAQEFGGPKVFSYDDIDLEKPEFLSPPLRLYVFYQLELHGNVLSSDVAMPLHVRYHKPLDGTSHVALQVLAPEVFIACHLDADWLKSFNRTPAPCALDTSVNCTWMRIPCAFSEESLSFDVPVGNLQHFTVVAILTVLVISVAAVGMVARMVLSTTSTVPGSTAAVKKYN